MAAQTDSAQQLPVAVCGSSAFGRYSKISAEKTYNLFLSDNWLVSFAGYKKKYELFPAGTGRGCFRSVRGNFIIVVVNTAVYQLDFTLAPVFIGTLATNAGEVFIDENLNSQICIVDGVNAYIYNYSLAPNLTVQTLSGSLLPSYVTYHNTFFLFGNGTKTGNGAAWYAYSFTTATTISLVDPGGTFALQTKPDYAVAVKRIPGQSAYVMVFGSSVCEIFQNVGGLQNYTKNKNISIDYGCISVSTIASSDLYVVWLAVNESDGPVIMVYSGQTATPISTDGIDYVLGEIKYPAQSTAMFARVDGHLFYQLTFYNPADNLTLMYDFNTQKFFNLSDTNLNFHPARDYVYFNQRSYFVALNNCSVYEMSTEITVYDENVVDPSNVAYDPTLVNDIQRIRITDTLRSPDNDRFIANRFTMTIEQGQDVNVSGASLATTTHYITEQGIPFLTEAGAYFVTEDSWGGASFYTMPYQPRIDLSLSYDDGVTWSSTVGRNLNPVGYRKNILSWNKLGIANTMIVKLRFWGTSRVVAYGGIMEVY